MKTPLKLSAIEQEHLQDLYDAAGIARDELPYTPVFEQFVSDFQDRTFKNGDAEQVYGALIKYARTGAAQPKGDPAEIPLTDDQRKQLKPVLAKHASGGKVLPYSDAFVSARNEFKKVSGAELTDQQFWQAIIRTVGAKRRPPPPRAKASKADDDDE